MSGKSWIKLDITELPNRKTKTDISGFIDDDGSKEHQEIVKALHSLIEDFISKVKK